MAERTICDHCGEDVCTLDHPAIHGWLELYQQHTKTARLQWIQKVFSGYRVRQDKREEGVWCNFDCFTADMAKTFNREFDGMYPKKDGK